MLRNTRNIVMQLTRLIGQLSEVIQWKGNHPIVDQQEVERMKNISLKLKQKIQDLDQSIQVQHTVIQFEVPQIITKFTPINIEELREKIHSWCGQRKWEQYHTPRNLVFALVGEVGELCEIFEDDYQPGLPELNDKIKFHIGEEMADILHNLIRLSDQCNMDLSKSLLLKMEKNSLKYPVDKVYGSSKKYDEY